MSRVYFLGGRTFSVPEHTTARQDAYMIGAAIESGVMTYAGKPLDEATTLQLAATIFRSGQLEYLLAAALVEDDVPWTTKGANANAEFFAALTDPIDKQQILNGIVAVLTDFFRNAPLSSTGSRTASSGAPTASAAPSSDDATSIVDETAAIGAP